MKRRMKVTKTVRVVGATLSVELCVGRKKLESALVFVIQGDIEWWDSSIIFRRPCVSGGFH